MWVDLRMIFLKFCAFWLCFTLLVLMIIPSPPNPLDHSLFILFEYSLFVSYVMLILSVGSRIPTKTLPDYLIMKYYGANWCLSCKLWRCFCKITIFLAMCWVCSLHSITCYIFTCAFKMVYHSSIKTPNKAHPYNKISFFLHPWRKCFRISVVQVN